MDQSAMCMQTCIKEELDCEDDNVKIEIVEEELRKTENHLFASQREEPDLANESKCVFTDRSAQDLKQRSKKKNTFCNFCNLEVTNFDRHVERHHGDREEVKELLSFPKYSKERKKILGLLRNSGHFTQFLAGNVIPKYSSKDNSEMEYYPCPHCKGLYSKKYLSRHCKSCAKLTNHVSKKCNSLSASQTLIACSLKSTSTLQKSRVREEVFDTMKADDISLVAKTDPLICHYGEYFLQKSNTKYRVSNCSFRMRELAKLLMELRLCTNNDKYELRAALHPVMFNSVIKCAKNIGGYNPVTNTYRSPNLTAGMGRLLKQASDLLVRLILKQDSSMNFEHPKKKIKDIKQFRNLISEEWNAKIGCATLNDIRQSKPAVLPLAKDILTFKEFVIHTANKAVAALREHERDKEEFKTLVDATLVLTILYNRKRIDEVQCTKIQGYLQKWESANQEKYLNVLTASEKFLTRHCKVVLTRAKHRRATVIFFPPNIQEYVDMIIEIRNSTDIVPDKNPYLFGYPDTYTWPRGYLAILTFTRMVDLEYSKDFTSFKFRKQIATIMQISNINEEESLQFAQFMGYSAQEHNQFCTLPLDVYQTAKLSKLLMLMDKGLGDKYKGKSLQEIDIDPQVEYVESIHQCTNEKLDVENTVSIPEQGSSPSISSKGIIQSNFVEAERKTGKKSRWSRDERKVVTEHFQDHIKQKVPPKKYECEELLEEYPQLFIDKDWVKIKAFVYNKYRESI